LPAASAAAAPELHLQTLPCDPLLPLPGQKLPSLEEAATGISEGDRQLQMQLQLQQQQQQGQGPPSPASSSKAKAKGGANRPSKLLSYLVTADHSPEAPTEFERLRRTRPQNTNTNTVLVPELLMVYDSPSGAHSKASCPPIFDVNKQDPTAPPRITNNGKYYKNVRSEWASLVTTPPSARFQDALAFTRSLGDLHLQSFGVTFLPEIFEVDLDALLPLPTGQHRHGQDCSALPDKRSSAASASSPVLMVQTPDEATAAAEASSMRTNDGGGDPVGSQRMVTVLACSDGIWDNWKFDECMAYATAGTQDGRQQARVRSDPPLPPGTRLVDPLTVSVAAASAAAVSAGGSAGGSREGVSLPWAQEAANKLIAQNAKYAHSNFGSSADNATAVVAFIFRTQT